MREFFRGWRRKAGLATLAMTLLLTAGWMRSYVVRDTIVISRPHYLIHFESLHGGLGWFRYTTCSSRSPDPASSDRFPIQWVSDDVIDLKSHNFIPWFDYEIEWQCHWLGFTFGAGTFDLKACAARIDFWLIPYWSLVWPLTLLSAWLLLIKPWPAKSAKESSRA